MDAIEIMVDWEWEYGDGLPPDRIISIPMDVYEEGMFTEGFVENWLSDEYGFLVRDWRLSNA